MKPKPFLIFTFASLLVCLAVFGPAMWGGALLAPVDLAPALFGHYRFVDPASDGIPANHHLVDLLAYDLPPQWTFYNAYHRGEIPWWDPYTWGGRPLLAADAHLNGCDPIRILSYLTIPKFELAYNWTRILHSLIGGLGFFYLLSRFRIAPVTAGLLALSGQFAGCTAIYFGHPWIHSSFIYYPWLWAVWHAQAQRFRPGLLALGALLAAAVFCAGNLQSHSYLVLFALAWIFGYGGSSPKRWLHLSCIAGATGVLGALFAAPALGPHLELFLRSERLASASTNQWHWFDGILSLSGFYPWAIGTWRTVGYENLGFNLFIGSAAFILAGFGLLAPPQSPERIPVRRCAIASVLIYFTIMSTPLAHIFYARSSGLGVLGLIVLAAFGTESLFSSSARFPRVSWSLAVASVIIAVGTPLFLWLVYPRVYPRLLAALEQHAVGDYYGGTDLALRQFQARNLPHEISFANPEVFCAWMSLAALTALVAVPNWRRQRLALPLLLLLNAAPEAIFARRFIVKAPVAEWEKLLAGSDEQRAVLRVLQPRGLRLAEKSPADYASLFPKNFPQLYKVHAVYGYTSLQPYSQAWHPSSDPRKLADYLYETDVIGAPGRLIELNPLGNARFSWESGAARPIVIDRESQNQITLSFPPGPEDRILRTDTYYPGWRAVTPEGESVPVTQKDIMFSSIQVPSGVHTLTLSYFPRTLAVALWGPVLALIALLTTLCTKRRMEKRQLIKDTGK